VNQVQSRVDQRAVKVEDQKLNFPGIEWTIDLDQSVLSE